MVEFHKRTKIILGIASGAVVVLGLLVYFQSQGILKVFPNAEDRRQRLLLDIDESKFAKPEGLPDETFTQEIQKLYELKTRVENNRSDADAWFDFGYQMDFLNDHEGGVAAWEKALELQPGNFVTAFNLGDRYQYFLKDYQKSEMYYNKSLAIKPDFTSAYEGLGDLYRFNWKEKHDEFESLMIRAINNDLANRAKYYVTLVEYFVQTDLGRARGYYIEVKQLDPEGARQLAEDYPELVQ